jgi:hypothetical protein
VDRAAVPGISGWRKVFYQGLRDGLIAFAESEFRLSQIVDRVPYREILQGLLDRTKSGDRQAELEAELFTPPAPAAGLYLLHAYHRIRRRKAGSGFGPSPIEWPDIDAFCRFSRMTLVPWEVEIIEALDDVFLAAQQPQTP